MQVRTIIQWLTKHAELLAWTTALVALFFLPADKPGTSLCLFTWLGFGNCPGCGMGHALHYALHLDAAASFEHHPMGIPGLIIIFSRIKQLLYPPKPTYET